MIRLAVGVAGEANEQQGSEMSSEGARRPERGLESLWDVGEDPFNPHIRKRPGRSAERPLTERPPALCMHSVLHCWWHVAMMIFGVSFDIAF